jgi:hypothetical protein
MFKGKKWGKIGLNNRQINLYPIFIGSNGRIFTPGHVSLGSAMPYHSKRPPLKQPYSCFRGGSPQGREPALIFYPFGQPTLYA